MDDEYASSENDQDELMEVDEVDNDAEDDNDNEDEDEQDYPDEPEAEPEAEQEPEPEPGAFDQSQSGQDGEADDPPRRASAAPSTTSIASKQQLVIRQEYLTAADYDIVPTMAAPMGTSINCLAITPNQRFWMTGGSDGYIRKHDGIGTINGKLQLTVAQRHPFVDSVVKAGILMSYWANEEPSPPNVRPEDKILSPVYSLAIHSDALWLLSGLESGGINLSSVRHDEGKRIATLRDGGHTNAVSVLQLAPDERSVLSGSWDKICLDWDLNNGQVTRRFDASGGQISAIELRPANAAPIPAAASELEEKSETFRSNNDKPPVPLFWENGPAQSAGGSNDGLVSDMGGLTADPVPTEATGSPEHESLFGSPAGSLFGDNDTLGGGGGGAFGDDDDEFSRAMDMSLNGDNQHDLGHSTDFPSGDVEMSNTLTTDPAPAPVTEDQNNLNQGDSGTSLEPDTQATEPSQDVSMDIDTSQPMTDVPPSLAPEQEREQEQQQLDPPPSSDPDNSTADHNNNNINNETQVPSSSSLPNPASSLSSSSLPNPSPGPSMVLDNPAPVSHAAAAQANPDVFLAGAIDGTIRIWDKRVPDPVARINNRRGGSPPWLMGACWSLDGNFIYAGRRNGTVEEFAIHKATSSWAPERVLKLPNGSGPVSCVRPMANGRHLVCASHDILRLYDLSETPSFKHSKVPFTIIPGPPKAGVISSLYIDPTSRVMISAAGTRGWEGHSTECLIGYEINPTRL